MTATTQLPAGARPAFDLVCLTASLGGVHGYRDLLTGLPADFPVPLLLIQHRAVADPDRFTPALAARCPLPVVLAADGERLTAGVVHVVPGGYTATLDPARRIRLTPAVGHRLSDAMFASAAARFGPRLLAVVLSGRLDDGAVGVRHVKGAGGRVLAQGDVLGPGAGMPTAASATGCVDFVLPLPMLADAITALVMAPGAAGMMRVALPPWARAIATDGSIQRSWELSGGRPGPVSDVLGGPARR